MKLPDVRSTIVPMGQATYLASGKDREHPVLLLHGGGLDCATLSWRCLFPRLAAKYMVVAPNWPEYAGSTSFGRPYTIQDLGSWLIRFMDKLDIEKAALVGVSMGGGAALWTAVHHPDRVSRLVPVGTYGVSARAPYHCLTYLAAQLPLNRWSYDLMRQRPVLLRRALEMIFADPQKVSDELIAEVRRVLDGDVRGEVFSHFQRGETRPGGLTTFLKPSLSELKHPTLFIHGRADRLVRLSDVRKAAEVMPNATVEVMDAGHWPMRECPKEFNSRVLDFLSLD